MKAFVCSVLVLLLSLTGPSAAKDSAPKVQVYTRTPGQYGKSNTLICHITGFHPPEIIVELLKNGAKMPDAKQTDLAFEENWYYHISKYAPFTPEEGDVVKCEVTHQGKKNQYAWEPDV